MISDEILRNLATHHVTFSQQNSASKRKWLMQYARAVEAEARKRALEEAAEACERIGEPRTDIVKWATNRCAGKIRALAEG